MGIFPIIMNTLQFWLIDSIVKASPEESVSLNTDAHDGLDREPLFRASEDDDGDEGQVGQQRYDVENPRALNASSHERGSSSGNTSGSVTPVPTGSKESESDAPSDTGTHSYPPSLSSSITSTSSSTSSLGKPPIREATKLGKKRKTAPTPLHVHQSSVPAINSPGQVTAPLEPKIQDVPLTASHDWDDGWGDEADDWADKVGEEDWTGRRMGEARDDIENTWSREDGQISHT